MKSLKLFSIFFLLLVTGYWLLVTSAFAQAPPAVPTASWVDDLTPQKLEQEIKSGALSKETSTTHTLNVLTTAGVRMIVGPIQEEVGTEGMPYRPGGAIGGVTNLIAAMYANPPASGVDYLADLGRNLGIVSPAYAQQGVGFGGLSPILPIWKAFRNIAYLFFIIIFIATGFAIMFRMKISPQAVMTIQSAIPRVVIALILVTFSYAIAGFIIDLMYVLLTLGIAVLGPPATDLFSAKEIADLQKQFLQGGFPNTIGALFKIVPITAWVALGSFGALIGAAIGAALGPVIIATAGIGVGVIWLIFSIVVLFAALKLLFELLKAYIGILFGVIFGPLQIMLGVLPGQSGIGGWLMGLFANLMVFPAVAMVLLIGRILTQKATQAGDFWSPPMIVGIGSSALPALIGLGIMLMISKVPEMVKQALGQKPAGYGTAIGEALGPVKTVARYPLQYGAQEITAQYGAYPAGIAPRPIARGKALADVLRTLGVIK